MFSQRRPRLLIAEDDSIQLMLLEDIMADLGADIAAAVSDYASAMRAAESEAIDAALLDVLLDAKQSSFAIADSLRRRNIPFAFITGYPDMGLPAPYRDVPIIPKPYTQETLSAAVRSLLDRQSSAKTDAA